jgi:ParB/RepB/Spo0J family partition protein
VKKPAAQTVTVQILPVALIDEPLNPMRETMEEADLAELGISMQTVGQIHPVWCEQLGSRYRIIVGHRRLIAARAVGMATLQAFVVPAASVDIMAIMTAENSRREAVNPAEEARWIQKMFDGPAGHDVDKICGILKVSRQYVDNRLALTAGCPRVLAAVEQREIGLGVALLLNQIPQPSYRAMYLEQAMSGCASTRIVKVWVEEFLSRGSVLDPNALPDDPGRPAEPLPVMPLMTCFLCSQGGDEHEMKIHWAHQSCITVLLRRCGMDAGQLLAGGAGCPPNAPPADGGQA